MSNLLSLAEKRSLARLIEAADHINEGRGLLTMDEVRPIVGEERDNDVTDILNGMLTVLGYHETLIALNGPTRNAEIIALYENLYKFIDQDKLSEAQSALNLLQVRLSGEDDSELSYASGMIDFLLFSKKV